MRSDRHPSSTAARLAAGTLLLACLSAPAAHAQTSDVLACTTGPLANCAQIRLTSTPGAGTGGAALFEIALRNAGSTSQPALPTSVYNLVLGTGLAPVAPAAAVSASVVPVAVGGATLADPAAWDLFESGNAIFLSALSDAGVGGCVSGAAVDGFGQAGTTCGVGQFLTFRFSTPRLFDPRLFTVLDLEVVGLAPGLPADACGAQPACVVTTTGGSTVPEPAMLPLLATGFALVLGRRGWRRTRARGEPG